MEGHGAAPPPPAAHQSPSQTHAYTSYSPADPHARHRSGSYNGVPPSPNIYHRSVPASPTVARQPLPAQSPSTTRDRPTSSYYDPTSEARASVNHPSYHPRSPISGRAHYDSTQPPVAYANGHNTDTRTAYSRHSSQASPPLPYASIHAHPPTAPLDARSPTSYREPARSNGTHSHTASLDSSAPAPAPARSTNPMSMMNLLSDNAAPPSPAPKPSILRESSPVPAPAPAPVIAPAPAPMPVPEPVAAPVTARAVPPPSPPPVPVAPKSRKGGRISAARSKEAAAESRRASAVIGDEADTHSTSPRGASAKDTPASAAALINLVHTGPPGLSEEGTEAAFIEIENADLSDVEAESDFFRRAKTEWLESRKKRGLEIELQEDMRRKRRKMLTMQTQHDHFFNAAESEKTIYVDKHEQEVAEEVRLREIEEDKERKKDQQRKRRREKAIADEQIKQEETLQKLASAKDDDERMRLEKEVQRHAKKIRDTQNRLQGIVPSKEPRTESPHNAAALGRREREVNLDGGLMTSFFTGSQKDGEDAGTPEHTPSGRGRGRGGRGGAGAGTGRARKSKEQKLAEKENARLAQSFIDQGQDLPSIAPKEEERLASYSDRRRDDSEPLSDAGPTSFDVQPTAGLTGMARFESKGYNQVYEQITREVAKVCIPKAIRIKNSSLDTKQSNARKTAQLASKEAKRWQQRTNKSTKDVAARAKRAMREMLGFWKRNERDEREGRKVAEKHELEKARRAEADREANRQKRKLNFLISQTELYSHFIGKKVKTDEIERSGNGDIVASNQTTTDDPNATHTVNLPDSVANLNKKVTNFEDLDFDAEDETALQEAAMANAQNAIKEAQDRAREFNKPSGENDLGDAQANMDEGELNFQNPTSLQSMDVEQPKMLTCKLKEYQLKGLNWLVNLYEQGINGILADEMGLGKTVQSISVMAYLAEVHDIWGPFLVIAPASTLHNWQQEITKFVPTIKVLPYWGSAKDRKVLRKFWDRKHITYNRDSPFHVLVTSYQLVVQDTAYFQKVKWQYMILDEAQAIKSSSSSRWKSLLGFHCRNRLLLTGTPIQNNMQELWALLHFIMPSLFDSHDEFSEWFSKDIENHAQSNSKLNEDQLRRLHMILKPFMLRRIKKHVQKELGDKIELDVFCDLTYRQRAYYTNLRNKISIMDLIEKAAVGDDQDTATLMNLVMQFRKVCNHPDLFERAEIKSPLSMSYYAETASFMREGTNVNVSYSVRNLIEYWMPKMLAEDPGRLNVAGPKNSRAGWRNRWLQNDFSIWDSENVYRSSRENGAFSWLRFVDDQTANDTTRAARDSLVDRVVTLAKTENRLGKFKVAYDDEDEKENANFTPLRNMLNIVGRNDRKPLAEASSEGHLNRLFNISREAMDQKGYSVIETCYLPAASAPPIELVTPSEQALVKRDASLFNVPARRALYPITTSTELALLQSKLPPTKYPVTNLLPAADQVKQRYTKIEVPSMRRFVTDSGKLARLDQLLRELKEGGHRVLLYFQMTRMIDLMEEYLTYRNYKYCRLDGSTKLEDRRDTVAAFQSSPEIFVFLLSTRAGGLGINLVAADTVIFYDSDWNPTIDSQAMDRAHRLGQTRQVTVYRLITRGTIEERIRKRALQKEEVQRVVISGQTGGGNIDFNNRSHRENNRTKEMAMWLADDEQAAEIERREAEVLDEEAKAAATGKPKKRKSTAAGGRKGGKEVSMDDMYHEGEGKFDDGSHEPSGAATPIGDGEGPPMKKRKGISKKAKTISQRLAVIDGQVG